MNKVFEDATTETTRRHRRRDRRSRRRREWSLLKAAGNDRRAYNSDGRWVLPAPATFVLDSGGVVRYANVRGDWTERAQPSDVIAGLVAMAARDAGWAQP